MCYPCSYVKWVWYMSECNKLLGSDFQYVKCQSGLPFVQLYPRPLFNVDILTCVSLDTI